jgi:hypothetical protein
VKPFLDENHIKSFSYSQNCDANVPTKITISKFEMKFQNDTSSISTDINSNGKIIETRVPDNCLELKIKFEFSATVIHSKSQTDRFEKMKIERKKLRTVAESANKNL